MSTTEITSDNFTSIIENNDIVVLDAWASWCAPCRSFAPIYEAASERHPDVVWGKLDTESQREIAGAFNIRSIPMVMVFRQGVLLFQQGGLIPGEGLDELLGKIRALDMEAVHKEIEEHERAHAAGQCNHDHGPGGHNH